MNRKFITILILVLTVLSITGCKKKCKHSIEILNKVEATCTVDGLTEGKKCSKCGEIILKQEVIKATGHNEVIDSKVESTCSQPGKTEGSHCSICNEVLVKQEEIEPISHEYNNWITNTVPTLTQNGLLQRTCKNCSSFETKTITYEEVTTYINDAITKVLIPTETTQNIELPKVVDEVNIKWQTSNEYLLSSSGEVLSRSTSNKKVYLNAIYSYCGIKVEKRYDIVILGYTNEEKINFVLEDLVLPEIVTGNLEFDTTLKYNVKAEYVSSNEDVLTNEGKVIPQNEDKNITITVILTLGDNYMEKSFDMVVKKYDPENKLHQLTIYANEIDLSKQEGLRLVNDRIELEEGLLEATYYSEEYETMDFYALVGSWAALSSENATTELKVSARVNGVWSDYISYHEWGLGLQNALSDQSNSLIKLVDDEVMVQNSKLADGVKYTITFRRTSLDYDSPKLSLVSFALQSDNHSHFIDATSLPEYVNYEVPQLNQNIVPTIGNSICSATSTTMLLKYYGFNFSDKDAEFEHRYIASIVKDYGNNIYGNWVYNTATMGAYGLKAYLARMYSLEELMYHLANVGPVALTVKGTMTSNVASYTTQGHLIVCTGYKYVDGELVFLCNDPNVKVVACEYTKSVMNSTWRRVAYVIEKEN